MQAFDEGELSILSMWWLEGGAKSGRVVISLLSRMRATTDK